MTEQGTASARILVVEDHDDLAEALAHNLRHGGYVAECVRDGRLRADGIRRPVLILSARRPAPPPAAT